MKDETLPPIIQSDSDFDPLEDMIRKLFRDEIYLPLVKDLKANPARVLKNAVSDALKSAIESGKVIYRDGIFSGKFSAAISKRLKDLGGVWVKDSSSFKLPRSKLPQDLRNAIDASLDQFLKTADKIDKKLAQILPEEIADKLKSDRFFDTALYKTESKIHQHVEDIIVSPKISVTAREKIASEYTNNLRKYIKEWTSDEIVKLRKDMQKHVLSGGRYEDMIETIQKRYEVSANKAKFLARQESKLMITKFQQTQYTGLGIYEYIWKTVTGTKLHPVRAMHKKLDGKKFSWNNPPITDAKGNRNNPGEDFNCRCFARPIIKL